MTEEVRPIAYAALEKGTPMLTRSDRQFGTVEQVLQIQEEDLFDGIVVAAPHGLRFVDRAQIDEITNAWVRCNLTDAQAAELPEPEDGPPVFQVRSPPRTGRSLHSRLGRLFHRPRWTRKR
jgi:hypothetical protein